MSPAIVGVRVLTFAWAWPSAHGAAWEQAVPPPAGEAWSVAATGGDHAAPGGLIVRTSKPAGVVLDDGGVGEERIPVARGGLAADVTARAAAEDGAAARSRVHGA